MPVDSSPGACDEARDKFFKMSAACQDDFSAKNSLKESSLNTLLVLFVDSFILRSDANDFAMDE